MRTVRRLLDTSIGRTFGSWALARRARRGRRHAFHYEDVLGTSFELQVVADRDADAQRAESEALSEVDRLERILSGWSRTSELVRWQATNDEDVAVSPELAELLDASERWRQRTAGAFCHVARLWRIGRKMTGRARSAFARRGIWPSASSTCATGVTSSPSLPREPSAYSTTCTAGAMRGAHGDGSSTSVGVFLVLLSITGLVLLFYLKKVRMKGLVTMVVGAVVVVGLAWMAS